MVERLVANQKIGVRFSLPAQNNEANTEYLRLYFGVGKENRKTEAGTRCNHRVAESGEEVLNKTESVGRMFYLGT